MSQGMADVLADEIEWACDLKSMDFSCVQVRVGCSIRSEGR